MLYYDVQLQLIQFVVFYFLSINLSNGIPSTLFVKNKTNTTNRLRRQTNHDDYNCQIPDDPFLGEYSIGGDDTHMYKTGDYVPEYRVLLLNCTKGYKPSPPEQRPTLCLNGLWQPEPRICSRTCRPLSASKTMQIQCSFNNKPLETCNDPVEGTVAQFSCEALYEDVSIEYNPFRLCEDGNWDGIPSCFPICGQKHPIGRTSAIGGTIAAIGDYPWQVGIYTKEKVFQCGGAVISPSVILSAAHCFADLGNGTQYPKENYLVAVGKHYRHYYDSKDEYSQYPAIAAIHIPSQYRGSKLQHESDIAVIILATSLTLSEAVQPVCVDWTNLFEHQQLVPDNYGVVTGWGFTREGLELADELKELSVPFVPFDKCFQNVPMSFQKYLRSDKICGGYINSSTSVCQGDSGGALVFPRSSNGRFYIRGIVSTSPATRQGQCDSNQYGLFTLVSKHMEFVSTYYHISRRPSKSSTNRNSVNTSSTLQLQTKISNGGVQPATPTPMPTPVTTVKPPIAPGSCKIPEFPPNATYLVGGSSSDAYKPGDYVTEFDSLILNCNKKFIPNPVGSAYSLCVNGIWNPQPTTCSQWCLPLTSTKTTKVRCKYNDVWLENCNNPIEGTVAEISCEPFYEEPSIKQNSSRVCRDGAWDYPISQCYPVCGKKRTKGHTKRKQNVILSSDFPWQIGIYKADKTYLCGGVLIDEHVVLTAAHCVTNDYDGSVLSKENYLIAAGKYYSVYDDPRDEKPQYSTVDAIYVPERFKGRSSFYQADIAVIILASAFDLSESVQPVCIDFTNEFENEPLISSNNGVLAGWSYPKSKNETAKELNQTSVPSVPYKQCIDEIIPPFRRYLTYDKICAGDLHNGVTQICRGYSGGALAVPRQRRYYAIGILSVQLSPQREIGIVCDSNLYGGYTLISKHLSMLQDVMTRLRLSRNNNRSKLKLWFMLF